MKKILTIVVPTYDMENYLDRCLSSLFVHDNLMNLLEVVVVNDGSKDRSSEVAHRYEKSNPMTCRVIDKENGNYGSCVNRGLQEAKGKYIKVLDADDSFDTANFERFLTHLQGTDADCVISDMAQVDANGSIRRICNFKLPADRSFALCEMGGANIERLWMHCVCYKTENLRRIHYRQTEGISYTDQEWLFLPMAASKTLEYWPHTVYKYLVGREGQTIDTSVWERNFWMEVKGVRVMMSERSEYEEESVDHPYLDARMAVRIKTLYSAYFTRFKSSLNNDILRDFDLLLKERNPALWGNAASWKPSRCFPWKPVESWRRRYDSEVFSVRMLRVLSRSFAEVRAKIKMLLKPLGRNIFS